MNTNTNRNTGFRGFPTAADYYDFKRCEDRERAAFDTDDRWPVEREPFSPPTKEQEQSR